MRTNLDQMWLTHGPGASEMEDLSAIENIRTIKEKNLIPQIAEIS